MIGEHYSVDNSKPKTGTQYDYFSFNLTFFDFFAIFYSHVNLENQFALGHQ